MKKLFITIMMVFVGLLVTGCGGSGSNPTSPIVTLSIVSITPTSGGPGTQVSIQGTGFGNVQGASVLSYAGITVIPNSWSDTLIMATIPSTAVNNGPFLVTVNGQYSNASTIFTLGTPQITSISPTTGAPGTVVYISGTGFGSQTSNSRVGFNGQSASIQSWSNNTITCLVPTITNTQPGNVSVLVWVNSSLYSNAFTFNVSVPTISNVTPTPCNIGATLTITGQGFGVSQGISNGQVTIGAVSATIQGWQDTSITCKVPSGSGLLAGPVNVVVTASSKQSIPYSISISAPQITTYSPAQPKFGNSFSISGQHFGNAASEGPGTISLRVQSSGTIYPINNANWSPTSLSFSWPVPYAGFFSDELVDLTVTVGGLSTTVLGITSD